MKVAIERPWSVSYMTYVECKFVSVTVLEILDVEVSTCVRLVCIASRYINTGF